MMITIDRGQLLTNDHRVLSDAAAAELILGEFNAQQDVMLTVQPDRSLNSRTRMSIASPSYGMLTREMFYEWLQKVQHVDASGVSFAQLFALYGEAMVAEVRLAS